MSSDFPDYVSSFIKDIYKNKDIIPLHEPQFSNLDKEYLNNAIDSTYVSSDGEFIREFEENLIKFTRAPFALSVVNGTSALHLSLISSNVKRNDIVLTQSLTFVATVNAIKYQRATPLFIDVSKERLSICPIKLEDFLENEAFVNDKNECILRSSKKTIKALVVVHVFGHPAKIDEIKRICDKWCITLIEDAAESLGSFYQDRHTGTFGEYGAISFNGNKIITTGGGGAVLCSNIRNGEKARHIATTAKARSLDFYHDKVGYNYRMPNLNAALGCAQFKYLESYIDKKRELASKYEKFFEGSEYVFVKEPTESISNYWLNTILAPSKEERDRFIKKTNKQGILTRPSWYLMHKLPMFKDSIYSELQNTEWLSERIINLPSSPI